MLFFTLGDDRSKNGHNETPETYYTQLFNYCLIYLHFNRAAAEECTQDVYATYYANDTKESIPALKEWLFRTADNFLNRYIRQLAIEKRRTVPLDEDKYAETDNGWLIYEQDLEIIFENDVNIEKHAEQILSSLSEKDQKLYGQYFRNHVPIKDLAAEYSITEGAMRARIHYVKQHILRKLQKLRENDFFGPS